MCPPADITRGAPVTGATAIITGLSSSIAQTLVDLGVDVSMIRSVGDLQGGLEEAERLLEEGHAMGEEGQPELEG